MSAHNLWVPGQRVAVAVSGGLDSVVLLDLLRETSGAHGAHLEVVTIDHGTRPESPADARFVEELAAGLPCTRVDLTLGEGASEERCRAARYAAFDRLDVDVVALAHHRRDQAETVLLHLLRGSGTRGMGAMSWRRGRYVRPLLDTPHDALRRWAQHRGLIWREDSSNLDPRFLRNRVRREVIPLLEDLRPGAVESLARSAAVAAEDDAWLETLVDLERDAVLGSGRLAARWVADAPLALVARALRRISPGMSSGAVHELRRVVAESRGEVATHGGRWCVDGDAVVWHPPSKDGESHG